MTDVSAFALTSEDGGRDAYSLALRRWTDSGNVSAGTTSSFGGNGGVVAWSLVGAGLANASGDADFFSGSTVSLSSFLPFDYVATLRAAFDAWSSVANIEFIQVADGGGDLGVGPYPTIRIGAGYVDGEYNVLASAWYPATNVRAGDIVFDSGETDFWTAESFFLTATHEIGHTIGLDHSNASSSIMSAYINTNIAGLQSDDVAGSRALYGAQDFGANVYYMPSNRADLTLIDGAPSLTVTGNNLANAITGSAGAETFLGGGGGDTLRGGGGNDTLDGGTGSDVLYGDAGNDTFLFSSPSNGADTVADFTFGDRIALKGSAFGLAPGSLAAAGVSFVSGSAATGGAPTVILTGDRLYWDADGTGSGAAVQFATVNAALPDQIGQMSSSWKATTTGDFDHNGYTDILWQDPVNNRVGAWLMDASGTPAWRDYGTVNGSWKPVGVGDLNGDGNDDILWRNSDGLTGTWVMSGGNLQGFSVLGTAAPEWEIDAIGDFNGDGTDDIFWLNTTTRSSGSWFMNNGSFQSYKAFGDFAASWKVHGAADFNADGIDDLLFSNPSIDRVYAWLLDGNNGVLSANSLGSLGPSTVAGLGDYNADGTADVLFKNAGAGRVEFAYLSNGTVQSRATGGAVPSGWDIVGSGHFQSGQDQVPLWHDPVTGAVAFEFRNVNASDLIIV